MAFCSSSGEFCADTGSMYNYNERVKQQSSCIGAMGDMATSMPPPGYHNSHGASQYQHHRPVNSANYQNYPSHSHPQHSSHMTAPHAHQRHMLMEQRSPNPEVVPMLSPEYQLSYDASNFDGIGLRPESLASLQKNPISAFMEYSQTRHLPCRIDILHRAGTEQAPLFTAAAFLGERMFPVVDGRNKHDCRKRAAEKALRILNAEENMAASKNFRQVRRTHHAPVHDNSYGKMAPQGPPAPQVAKDPVSAFMEYAQSAQLSATIKLIGQSGQPHLPTFVMAAMLGDRQFEPVESSQKKNGKKLAALKALEALKAEGSYNNCPLLMVSEKTSSLIPAEAEILASPLETAEKNPVSMLYEIAQASKQTARIDVLGQSGPPHQPVFEIAAYLDDRQFAKVMAGNKKEGRILAAQKALRTLEEEGRSSQLKAVSKTSKQNPSKPIECKTHFDKIASVSHSKFDSLIAGVQASLTGRKILATIVMMSEKDNCTVVSVGSGNRCIVGDQMSLHGTVVNDSHAEVIAKRAFRRFLNKQMLLYGQKNSDCIFEMGRSNLLRVKPNITFHMYISTAPCGDGAIFSHSEQNSEKESLKDDEHRPIFTNDKTQGQLRTKLEKGEGTIPIEADFQPQTWDGIRRGERLRTMSCSDKICSWNVLGLQGSLLSNLMEPIYLSSITLGQLYSHGHLSRALCCRVTKACPSIDKSLPDKYKVAHPRLGQVTAWEPQRETERSGSLGVNWCMGDNGVEVIDGTYGVCHDSPGKRTQSRLSKENLFLEFKDSCLKVAYNKRNLFLTCTYHEAKQKATSYQSVKSLFYTVLKDQGYGTWVTKPVEGQQFK